MGVRRGGAKWAFALPLEIGTKNHNFFENLKLAANFRVIHLIIVMTVYLSVYDTDNRRPYGRRPWVQGSHYVFFPPRSALLVELGVRGVTRL